jgi:hypothetical protein
MVAASKPTSWLSRLIHLFFPLKQYLGTLFGGLGSPPFVHATYLTWADCLDTSVRYSEFSRGRYRCDGPNPSSALPPALNARRHTSICFGEYELSPSLIGLSPLRTSHPISFQPELVRPSIGCYSNFSLLMRRSPGFASAATDSSPYSDSLSLRLRVLDS